MEEKKEYYEKKNEPVADQLTFPVGKPGEKLVEMTVYTPQPPQKPTSNLPKFKTSSFDPNTFVLGEVPTPYYPPQYYAQTGLPPYMGQHLVGDLAKNPYYVPTIVQQLNIGTGGPTSVNHEIVNHVYEDYMPEEVIIGGMTTLESRIKINNFIRNNLFDSRDGDYIGVGPGDNTILSKIRFLDLNPFRTGVNPYTGLPKNFLLYRTCYPIRREINSSATSCAKNSTGINVRIYKFEDADLTAWKSATPTDRMNSEIVRDFEYYRYISNEVVSKKKSPHFVNMYGWYNSENTKIDWAQLDRIRNQKTLPNVTKIFDKSNKDQALMLLTESPNYNLIEWGKTQRQQIGTIKQQIRTGYHSKDEWYSILFQIMHALAVLQSDGLFFNDINVADNIFIKDVYVPQGNVKYWRYIIYGYEFYVPNTGSLVMFDSSYKDIPDAGKRKVGGTRFGDGDWDTTKNGAFKMFADIMDGEKLYPQTGDVKTYLPEKEIQDLVNKIKTEITTDSEKIIVNYIKKYMKQFIHSRVGTYLKDNEAKLNIRRNDSSEFRKGEMVVHEVDANTYKFVLFSGINPDGTYKIITKETKTPYPTIANTDYIESDVAQGSILHYNTEEPVQHVVNGVPVSINDIVDTYILI